MRLLLHMALHAVYRFAGLLYLAAAMFGCLFTALTAVVCLLLYLGALALTVYPDEPCHVFVRPLFSIPRSHAYH